MASPTPAGVPDAQHSSPDWMIGLAIALGAVALFSAKPIVVKLIYAHGVGSEVTLALRMAMSVPFYIAIGLAGVWRSGAAGLIKDRFWNIVGIGLIGYHVASYLDLLSLEFIPAQIERMVLFIYPVFVALIGWLVHGHKMSRLAWASLALAYLGIASAVLGDVQLAGSVDPRGILAVVASALFFAGYIVLSRQHINAVGAQLFTSIAMSAASLGILVHIVVVGQLGDMLVTAPVFWLGLVNAIFCTVLPSYLASMAIGRLGGQSFSIIGSAGPVFTSIMAVAILGEAFGAFHALGLGLVIAGIVLLQRTQAKTSRDAE